MSELGQKTRSSYTDFFFWRHRSPASDKNPEPSKVRFHGRITIENSDEMRTELGNALRQMPPILHVNLSDVSYLDTSGVATLVEAAGIARKQNNRMVLEGLHDQPRSLLEITHLDRLFEIAGQEVGK